MKFKPIAYRAYFNVPAGTFVPGEMKNVPGDLAVRAWWNSVWFNHISSLKSFTRGPGGFRIGGAVNYVAVAVYVLCWLCKQVKYINSTTNYRHRRVKGKKVIRTIRNAYGLSSVLRQFFLKIGPGLHPEGVLSAVLGVIVLALDLRQVGGWSGDE